jgi:uncharacterized protein YecT (DUF1311 family)
MSKAGGVIGLIAGIFGFIAAIITLMVGGLGAAFSANKAGTVVALGWGGILFSFLAIVFAAMTIVKPKVAGYGLIAVSILGAILGGTFVAICMGLALIGGFLAVVGAPKSVAHPVANELTGQLASDEAPTVPPKGKRWILVAGGASAILIGAALVANGNNFHPSGIDPLAQLDTAVASDLQAEGELSEIFALGGKSTDLQRENKLKEISGQVVRWNLPVYEVARSGDGFKVQTTSGTRIGAFGTNLIGTFVTLSPRSESERKQIENLKTGDLLSFKGRIAGGSFRSLKIDPAILVADTYERGVDPQNETVASSAMTPPIAAPAPSTATPVPSTVALELAPQPVPAITQATAPSVPPLVAVNGFAPSFDCAKVSTGPERLICTNQELSALDVVLMQTYKRFMSASPDKSTLKQEQNAWRKNERDACSTVDCIAKAYRDHIDDFEARSQYLSKPAEFR